MRAWLVASVIVLASLGAAAGSHPQQAGSHASAFDHKAGNGWWVEVLVAGSPARVDARDDGGAWVALEKKSWGAWAKSFHIEPAHRVQFRASWSDGAAVESCWFTHPEGIEQCTGTPPPPPPPASSGNFTFTHGGGNEWWVEAKVSPRPAAVQAMDTGGAWVSLSFKDWGEWAGSLRVEPGHDVKFRAHSGSGVWQESCWYAHPSGALRSCPSAPPAWPREGSFVKYHTYDGEYFPNYQTETQINATFTYAGGTWRLVCDGNTHTEVEFYNETADDWDWSVTDTPFHNESVGRAPPRGPEAPKLGDFASVGGIACRGGGASGTIFGPIRSPTFQNGSAVDVTSFYVSYEPIWPASHSGIWDAKTALVLSWSASGSHSGRGGQLTDTDAPLGTQVTPRASWPFEGSFVRYRANETGGETWSDIRYTFRDGGWHVNCALHESATVRYFIEGNNAPWHGPPGVVVGANVEIPLPRYCGAQWNELLVERTQSVMTTRNGGAYKAKVWYADEDDTWDVDFDVWWDANTRLYLEWDFNEWQGKLVDTDAPLAAG